MRLKKVLAALGLSYVCVSSVAAAIGTQEIAGRLQLPVDIANAGDGSGRLFFVLQAGKVVIFNGSKVLSTPFLDVSSSISCCGERGLLSLAFHPSYASNGFFYILYTRRTNGDITVVRFKVSGNPNVANSSSARTILTIPHRTYSNHNGGELAFGPDGYLYVSVGDGGSGGDPGDNAQNLGTLLGKLLRIDVNDGSPYAIPPSNPFLNTPGARGEIWARGLRNLWRFSFDRSTGNVFLADVGQSSWEEVNFQKASSSGGQNYGWRRMEGRHCFNPLTNCNNGGLKLPILEYSHSSGGCSITGGYVYRGSNIPKIYGTYLYTDFCDGIIRGATRVNGAWTTSKLLSTFKNISTFGEDEARELYFAQYASTGGAVYRIIAK